jgi:hypothetical protein
MSMTGVSAFFTEHSPPDLRNVLERVFAMLGVEACSDYSLWSRPQTPVRYVRGLHILDERELDRPNPSRFVGNPATPAEIASLAERYPYLFVSFVKTRSFNLPEAIQRDIPLSISDRALVGQVSLCIGPRDWYEEGHGPDPLVCEHYWGRSMFAVSLFGYGTPKDWNEYRRRVFDIPEFKQFQAELEAILGPVKRCITWSV